MITQADLRALVKQLRADLRVAKTVERQQDSIVKGLATENRKLVDAVAALGKACMPAAADKRSWEGSGESIVHLMAADDEARTWLDSHDRDRLRLTIEVVALATDATDEKAGA